MDKIDSKVLKIIDDNYRATYKEIAKSARIGVEAARYRLHKLHSEGVITGNWVFSDIGDQMYFTKILFKNKNITPDSDFFAFVVKKECVVWMAECEGYWDYIITLGHSHETINLRFLDELFTRYSVHFTEISILKATHSTVLNEKYLGTKPRVLQINHLASREPLSLIEKSLVKELTIDGRVSLRTLATKLNKSVDTIVKYYTQLMKRSVQKVRINHKKIGLEYYHLFLTVTDYAQIHKLEAYFIEHQSCVFIMRHLGKYNLHIELVAKHHEIKPIVHECLNIFSEIVSNYELCKIHKEFHIGIQE